MPMDILTRSLLCTLLLLPTCAGLPVGGKVGMQAVEAVKCQGSQQFA
jgi:hypothetical protein